MKTVCLIGAGNIGSRHLQGLARTRTSLNIFVIDPSDDSLKIARDRYNQIEKSKTKHKVQYFNDFNSLPLEIDLAIISTSSNVRKDVIIKLFHHSKVKYMILEKLLFQKQTDYLTVRKLIDKHQCKAWVNCSMRIMPYYQNIKKIFFGNPITYNVFGSQFGLITNAIHYIDHVAYITGCNNFTIDTSKLKPKLINSKRSGFSEIEGTLQINFKDRSVASLTCYSDGTAPVLLEIFSSHYRIISKESENIALISNAEENWKWKEIRNKILFQSEMTNVVTENIFKNGKCNLTSYNISMKLHLQLMIGLKPFLFKILKTKNTFPFT